MDYFDIFGIPVQLQVDKTGLHARFIALSRQFHPDYHAQAAADAQAEALDKSALLNKAYRTFQDTDETIRYVLLNKGLMEEEEKYTLPPTFLMEVMEINEQLMDGDAGDAATRESVEKAINSIQTEIYEPVEKIITAYQEGATSTEELLQVKEYYYKKKYLDRIRRQLTANS